jgi:hypothetical protein
MKTTSKILITLGILAVIAAAGLFFLFSRLDRIVAAAIEKYGSEATGTKVEVSSVRIRPKAGEGSIRNLSIGNPPGFSTPNAFRLEDITVAVDTGSIPRDPLVIDKVTVRAPRITYEINPAGQSNIGGIQKNVQGRQAKEPSGTKARDGGGKKKIIIRSLVIEKGEVSIQVAALPGKPTNVSLPRIELKDLGGKGGDSPGAIARQVLEPLVNQVIQAATRAGIGQYLGKGAEDRKKALEEKLAVPGKGAAKGAEEAVKKIFGK